MTADLYSIEAKGGILGLELWFNNPPLWGRRPPLPLGLGSLVVCDILLYPVATSYYKKATKNNPEEAVCSLSYLWIVFCDNGDCVRELWGCRSILADIGHPHPAEGDGGRPCRRRRGRRHSLFW